MKTGYQIEHPQEPLVLDQEDWTQEEWLTIKTLFGFEGENVEPIVVHIEKLEYFMEEDD